MLKAYNTTKWGLNPQPLDPESDTITKSYPCNMQIIFSGAKIEI